ncbi:MAG: hypothetical protein JWP29_2004 [Rhodoferax sp.]|nr:hypothetical protein [Rhodoferax sp.]
MPAIALSKDAEGFAYSMWRIMSPELSFQRPHIIHPRTRAALDELTGAGLLTRTDDKRGPMAWRPTDAMAIAVKKFRKPGPDVNFPMTTE